MGERTSGTLTQDQPEAVHDVDRDPLMFWAQIPAGLLDVADWDDHHSLHRAVMALFPAVLPGAEQERRAASKILFRLDETATGPVVLVQSLLAPTHLPPTAKVKAVHCGTAMTPGTPVKFRVAVNAVIRRRRPDGKHRDDPLPEDQVDEWLAGKLVGALTGVTILASARSIYGVDRNGLKKGLSVALQVDTLDGVGTVHDPNRLLELVVDGVGRAKAYGCGLLTLSPLRQQP
jgi:CRISPR system Cascade subunit CasE